MALSPADCSTSPVDCRKIDILFAVGGVEPLAGREVLVEGPAPVVMTVHAAAPKALAA